ncbi:hypothetical protein RD792_007306 [Penstemon davidsonii]|uniref:Protein kinase domain-containing protein n=1 Tax=Penstemon davidsonii TaxID=160366 RepID=A0ABR0D622_9LAMI|nr:hypothetical protein RD792_007306 [Penstemon davidsonii]
MEGSSGSNWQRSDSSRRLNSSSFLNKNHRNIQARTDNTTHDSGSVRKGREKAVWPHINNDVSLRQWLDNPERKVESLECLHIFSQIVHIVNLAHSQGIVVHNVRPSCFIMSSFNRVSFIESASCSDSSSDSMEYESNTQTAEFKPLLNDHKQLVSQLDSEAKKHLFPMKQILLMESNWYRSPEEATSCASDIYQLGVLLFELFCTFGSLEEKSTTMGSLRHRVLPPQLLLRWPKEASFCLWLLHPEPSSRPKTSDLLQSEFLNEPKDDIEKREAAIELKEKIEEQELLLEFLLLLQQRKQDASDSLNETISCISSDIEEVAKLQASIKKNFVSDDYDSCSSGSRKRIRKGIENDDNKDDEDQGSFLFKTSRLMKNFRKLESAYFVTRNRATKQTCRLLNRHSQISSDGRGSIERSSVSNPSISKERYNDNKPSRWINTFLEGLCKYLSYSKLKVKADLKQGDLLNSSNLVCSLSFDRDGEFFATAGVNKKIKVFEYNSILDENRDIHYPVVEMASRSKLSSICWNGYIKSQIASSNFEGLVQGVSVGTIRTKANVCCVQFPTDSARSLAFGSADHRIYYYDLRNSKMPLCTLVGHNKTVSYVKFIDSTTLVSASTDNTVKLWDLSMCTSRVLDCPLQSFTGHLNVKNFVGLSVSSEGYIATGSETNEGESANLPRAVNRFVSVFCETMQVYVYHKAFPMPSVSFKFNSSDSLSGDEVDDAAQFISSVCWRGQSTTLVAANSMGNIKVLEMA